MEDFDRVTSRVSLAAVFGALAGTGTSLLNGTPMRRTIAFTAFSCALTGTACFSAERGATLVSRHLFHRHGNQWEDVLVCHSIGGVVGGAILGTLYIGKPLHGVVFFVPLMLLIGTGEKLFQDVREEQIQRIKLLQKA